MYLSEWKDIDQIYYRTAQGHYFQNSCFSSRNFQDGMRGITITHIIYILAAQLKVLKIKIQSNNMVNNISRQQKLNAQVTDEKHECIYNKTDSYRMCSSVCLGYIKPHLGFTGNIPDIQLPAALVYIPQVFLRGGKEEFCLLNLVLPS